MSRTGTRFLAGEPCLLTDVKYRQHLINLTPGETLHFDKGDVSHDEVIGLPEGSTLRSSKGAALVAMRPRLADHVLRMKRGAAVMYPNRARMFGRRSRYGVRCVDHCPFAGRR